MIIFNDKSLIIRLGKNSDLKEIKNIDESLKITINKNEQTQKYNSLKKAIKNKNLIISSTKSTITGYLWYEYLWGDIPFIQPQTVAAIVNHHLEKNNDFTFATRVVDKAYTVVLRDKSGNVTRLMETREEGITILSLVKEI